MAQLMRSIARSLQTSCDMNHTPPTPIHERRDTERGGLIDNKEDQTNISTTPPVCPTASDRESKIIIHIRKRLMRMVTLRTPSLLHLCNNVEVRSVEMYSPHAFLLQIFV